MQGAAAIPDRSAPDKVFQALADPSRRAILESLMQGEAAVKDLTSRFAISQPAVSQHLALLKEAGLVDARKDGRCVYYRVAPAGMAPLLEWIAHWHAYWTPHVDRLEALLDDLDRHQRALDDFLHPLAAPAGRPLKGREP